MLGRWRRKSPHHEAAARLYAALAAQARQPAFFAELGVPDTVDGRFDLLALHAWMVIDRLRAASDGDAIAQALFDAMFGHLDATVREMGAQDLGVGRRIKVMAEGLHGRALAFRAAIAAPDAAALGAALRRNVFGNTLPDDMAVGQLAAYVRATVAALTATSLTRLLAGDLPWPTFGDQGTAEPKSAVHHADRA
ncbi:MAG TPA: ubiquinol-cytochrome C chaperone family protein [Vineibacter sp.]|nr:ubiquinol-cytochrome C chaperone family protein [Vineibacter sp.]